MVWIRLYCLNTALVLSVPRLISSGSVKDKIAKKEIRLSAIISTHTGAKPKLLFKM